VFANAFVQLQVRRHTADYDPSAEFAYPAVEEDLLTADRALRAFALAPARDRRAFCVHVLFRERRA